MAGVEDGTQVVEVGAGTGTLTRALAAAGASVVAYEIDSGLKPVLEEVTAGLDVDLRFADVMKVDLGKDLAPGEWSMSPTFRTTWEPLLSLMRCEGSRGL